MEAKIEKVEWVLKSIPKTIEVKDSEISFSPTNVDMIAYDRQFNSPAIDYMA